jgi:hypothetical protein
MVPQPGIESGSAAYEAAASPQCFRGKQARRAASRKMDKRTALPLSFSKNERRLHEAPSNSGRSRCQTAKVWVFRPRARSRRAHARIVSSFDTHAAANADAHGRSISGVWLSVTLRAHRVPPACLAEGGGPPPVSPVASIPVGSIHSVRGSPRHPRRRPPARRIVGTTMRSGR